MSDSDAASDGMTGEADAGLSATQRRILDQWYVRREARMRNLRRVARSHHQALIIDVRVKAAWSRHVGPSGLIDYKRFEDIIWELMRQQLMPDHTFNVHNLTDEGITE